MSTQHSSSHHMKAFDSSQRLIVFVFCASISVATMVIDHRTSVLQWVRDGVSIVADPMRNMSSASVGLGKWVADEQTPDDDLRHTNQALQKENLLLRSQLQVLQSIEAENRRLSELLAASSKSGHDVLLGELVEVSLEPYTHRVVVNRGSNDGVYVGQPVIDSEGIMGQVTGVSPKISAITLVTDAGHAIPVQVRRNGLRAIVYGVGQANRLSVPYLPPQANIRRGDMLVTSGLGGRFPTGHPVAEVSSVVADANEPFLAVDAEPVARLEYAKNVLLIWPDSEAEKNVDADKERRRVAEPAGTNIADENDANGA